MKVTTTPLADLLLITPNLYHDDRGTFYEGFHQERYAALKIPPLVQSNYSKSHHRVLRGLHYQLPQVQGKLVSVVQGEIFDVAVDIRKSSPTFGQFFSIILNDHHHQQIYIPEGFAHGFCVLSDEAHVIYHCTALYTPSDDRGIIWNDPVLNITWPVKNPILSQKDARYPKLSEVSQDALF